MLNVKIFYKDIGIGESGLLLRSSFLRGIIELIKKYGLPQSWNEDGRYGPKRYIEVQVWSEMG